MTGHTNLDLSASQRLKLWANNGPLGPGRGRIRVNVVPEGDVFRVTGDGLDFLVPSAKRWRLYKRGFQQRIENLARGYGYQTAFNIEAKSRVVDIGANAGEFSYLAAQLGAEVLSIEPDPRVFHCMKENVSTLKNVQPIQTLLWNEETVLKFHTASKTADSSIFQPEDGIEFGETEMTAQRLDTVMKVVDWPVVDLIKCDAEGAEPEVLEGAKSTLQRTKKIVIDTGPEREGKETGAACQKILEEAGFEVAHRAFQRRKMTIGQRADA